MFKTMITFVYISTVLAMASIAIVCAYYLFKNNADVNDYAGMDKHIKTCRNATFIFTFLAWLVSSFETRSKCLSAYAELSSVCFRLGRFWILYGFVCIAVCIFMFCMKKKNSLTDYVSKLRNICFLTGAVFLAVGFLLNV